MSAFWTRLRTFDYGSLPRLAWHAWRRSLQVRTVIISVTLSLVAIIFVGVYLSWSISQDLFDSRLKQSRTDAARAQVVAQQIFDSADVVDRADVQSVVSQATAAIRDASSSSWLALYRTSGQDANPLAPQDFTSPELSGGIITVDLRDSVREGVGRQYWQSVNIFVPEGNLPGIIVGSLTTIPGVGDYELYIGFDLSPAEATLAFIQQVLWIAGTGLLVLIGGIAWFVARLVVVPIRTAAATSREFAAGGFDERIPVQGEDVMATLAQSFNDMADSLQAQLRELSAISDVRERFVSDVSHELRTPLATMRLASDVVFDNRDRLDAPSRRSVELLHKQIGRFEDLLTDLLEISRYDAKTTTLTREPTNLVALTEEVVASIQTLAEGRGSPIEIHSPGGHCEADVDPRRIRRIIVNLVGNAVEHGEAKPIRVEIDSTASAVAVVVEDSGVGMGQDEVTHIFERFWRGDPSRQRTLGGTGLGLAIAWEDARAHDGAIDVWAEAGRGARFRLTLPRTPGVPAGESPLDLEPSSQEAQL